MLKISIVVPVLNGEEYIRECIDSLVGQTLKDIEIIVVDAGSTDKTQSIIREYEQEDNRVKLLISEKKSMGYQYNLGMAAAKGEYIGFCESDDYVADTMYEQLYRFASSNDLDYVRSDFDMFIGTDDRLFLKYHILAGNNKSLYYKVINPADHPELIYRDVNIWNGIYRNEYIKHEKIKQNETAGAAFQDMGFVIQTIMTASKAMYVDIDANKYRKDNVRSSIYDVKGVVNVINEFLYIKDITEKKKIGNEELLCAFFTRSYHCFCGFYDKLPPYSDCTDDIKKMIGIFFYEARSMYKDIRYPLRAFSGIDAALSLERIIADDIAGFDFLRRLIGRSEKRRRKMFFDHIRKFKRVVLFGAGEIGCSTYAFLRRNNYNGKCVFIDNNASKSGEMIMGIPVSAPDEIAVLNDGSTLFVVCVANGIEDIKEQLIRNGVVMSDICLSAAPIPHNSMEIIIEEQEGQ